MKYEETICIPRDEALDIETCLTEEPEGFEDSLSEFETIINTAHFADGRFIDVKCCGVTYREGESNLAFSEAVLFDKNGSQLCFTEPSDEYFGEWHLSSGDDEYVVNVKAA